MGAYGFSLKARSRDGEGVWNTSFLRRFEVVQKVALGQSKIQKYLHNVPVHLHYCACKVPSSRSQLIVTPGRGFPGKPLGERRAINRK